MRRLFVTSILSVALLGGAFVTQSAAQMAAAPAAATAAAPAKPGIMARMAAARAAKAKAKADAAAAAPATPMASKPAMASPMAATTHAARGGPTGPRKPRTAQSIACSGQADQKGLHGKPRAAFMRSCKKGG